LPFTSGCLSDFFKPSPHKARSYSAPLPALASNWAATPAKKVVVPLQSPRLPVILRIGWQRAGTGRRRRSRAIPETAEKQAPTPAFFKCSHLLPIGEALCSRAVPVFAGEHRMPIFDECVFLSGVEADISSW
jgi:hypothetical protein